MFLLVLGSLRKKPLNTQLCVLLLLSNSIMKYIYSVGEYSNHCTSRAAHIHNSCSVISTGWYPEYFNYYQ